MRMNTAIAIRDVLAQRDVFVASNVVVLRGLFMARDLLVLRCVFVINVVAAALTVNGLRYELAIIRYRLPHHFSRLTLRIHRA
jgi:hypothetical protein